MKVYVPATREGLRQETVDALMASGFPFQIVPMLEVESYYNLMRLLWQSCETFAIVEHDIVINPDTLKHFAECEQLWCAHSYEVYAGDVAEVYGGAWALGCARFRAPLMRWYPEAVDEAGKMDDHPKHPPRSYAVMDSTLTKWLKGPCSQRVHQHFPNVQHLHEYNRVGAQYEHLPPIRE